MTRTRWIIALSALAALSSDRVASWLKLGRELRFLDRQKDKRAQAEYEKKLRPVTLARRTVNLAKEWGNL